MGPPMDAGIAAGIGVGSALSRAESRPGSGWVVSERAGS